jgi:threonine synthase
VAKAAGRPLVVNVPAWADVAILDRLDDLDADIRICERRNDEEGDPCILRFRELVSNGAVPFTVQSIEAPWTIDGGRTLGFELATELTDRQLAPTRLLIQVGGAALASSTVQALTDAVDLGGPEILPKGRPALVAVQTEGCAPLARAFNRIAAADDAMAAILEPDGQYMWPWENPRSQATGILDDTTYDWRPVVFDMLLGSTTGGGPVVSPETDVVEAHHLVEAHTDIKADATGTAGLAGLLTARRDGCIDASEEIVILLTGVERS